MPLSLNNSLRMLKKSTQKTLANTITLITHVDLKVFKSEFLMMINAPISMKPEPFKLKRNMMQSNGMIVLKLMEFKYFTILHVQSKHCYWLNIRMQIVLILKKQKYCFLINVSQILEQTLRWLTGKVIIIMMKLVSLI